MAYEIWKLREHPGLLDAAADWFHAKWGIPLEAYRESMAQGDGKPEPVRMHVRHRGGA